MDGGPDATAHPKGAHVPLALRSNRARWAVPGVGAALVATALVVTPMVADASPTLPPRTAAQLLAATRSAADHPFSGTVVETARLGLPELPTSGRHGSTSLSLTSLVTGSHTARVWYAGPDRSRIALVGDLAETDVIRSGRDVWTWDSAKNTARHLKLPARRATAPEPNAITPDQAARRALAAIDPSTAVTVEGTATVAGRPAYELVLRPRDQRSLVAQVRLAIDSATSTPLRVQVFARGAEQPAFETAFSTVTFATPPASVFTFLPPPGAKVSEQQLPAHPGVQDHGKRLTATDGGARPKDHSLRPGGAPGRATVVGTGWVSVLVLRGVDAQAAMSSPELGALLGSARPVSGAYGSGRVLSTALVSALLLDDGRLFVGSVTPAVLELAAASPAAR